MSRDIGHPIKMLVHFMEWRRCYENIENGSLENRGDTVITIGEDDIETDNITETEDCNDESDTTEADKSTTETEDKEADECDKCIKYDEKIYQKCEL